MDNIDLRAIASVAGILISVIALVRTFQIDRRVYWEPYFKGKWKDIERILKSGRIGNEQLLLLIDSVKANSLYASAPSEEDIARTIHKINLTYDKRIKHYITKGIELREKIRKLVETYRDLDLPMQDLTVLVGTQSFGLKEWTDEEKDARFLRIKNLDIRYFSVLEKYSSPTHRYNSLSVFFKAWESMKDKDISEGHSFLEIIYTTRHQDQRSHELIRNTIANNSRYKRDRLNIEKRMDLLRENLMSLNTKIDATIDFYSTKYAES